MKNLCKLLFCLFFIATSCSKSSPEEVVPVSGLQLNKHELRLEKGGSDVLAVTITPANATDKTVSWVSTNPGIATVSDGIVIAVSPGTTEVIAKSGNYFDKCVVSVVIPASSINLNASKLEMIVGEAVTLFPSVLPKDTTDEIEWLSSNESVATVDNGLIRAISEGEVTISAKVGVLIASCEVSVKQKNFGPIDFNQTFYTIYNGGNVSIALTVANAPEQDLDISLKADGQFERVDITPAMITVPAGKITGLTVVKDKSLQDGDKITLYFDPPIGYTAGIRNTATVVYNPKEALNCSIVGSEYTFSDGMELVVVVTGARSGAMFAAEDDILIPAYISGDGVSADGSNEIKFQEGGFIVEKGSKIGKGHLVRRTTNAIERPLTARIGIADFEETRILSTGPSILIHIPKTEK